MQLAVADVDRDHARGAAPEQDVGEAAGRCADVEAVESGRVDAERVERVRELVAAARDVLRAARDRQLRGLVDLLSRLVVARDEPGHHQRLRLRSRLREAALDEEDVQPLPGHALDGRAERLVRQPPGEPEAERREDRDREQRRPSAPSIWAFP